MHIETLGSGPDLVLIHGWAMHGGIFAPLTPLLARAFRVHVVDLPGHGRSVASAEPIDPIRCAQILAGRLPRALWAGWSFGGLVSLQAALNHPAKVCGIVEIAASPRFVSAPGWRHGVPADVFIAFGQGLLDDYRGTIERFLALETLGSAQAHDELRALKAHAFERGEPALQVLEDGLGILRNTDLRGRLAQLLPPSLWIAGRRDRLVPSAAMHWSSQQCAGGIYREIASGHAPFLSHAREVADAIIAFADRRALA